MHMSTCSNEYSQYSILDYLTFQGLCIGFQCQLRKDQHHLIVQLVKTTLPILSTAVVQAPIPKPKGEKCVQVSTILTVP